MQLKINTDHNIAGHQASTLDQAVDGAANKLSRLIDRSLGRQRHQKSYWTDPGSSLPASEPEKI